MMNDFKLNFQDTQTAFADKSDKELKEKYRLFKTMNSPIMVSLGTLMTNFAFAVKLPISGIIKATIFEQFCGGETIQECEKTINKLGASNIGTILDFAPEGKSEEADFERTKQEVILNLRRAKGDKNIPFAVFKVTGIAPFETLEKVSEFGEKSDELPVEHREKWQRVRQRVEEICGLAYELEQPIFIDAEETWIQPAIDDITTEMMERYNKERCIVYNTIQLYRTDRLEFLKKSHEEAKAKGYFLGEKLVRGAYMEKERERAAEMGYPSPIHADKAATDRDFDLAVEYCLDNCEEIAFVAGTHNENSTQNLAQKMHDKGIPHNHKHIFFSQLFGMSDNLSYILAKHDYNVSKYVPYGPVKDAIPYLSRRAKENTSVMGQVSRELDLIKKELDRRKI